MMIWIFGLWAFLRRFLFSSKKKKGNGVNQQEADDDGSIETFYDAEQEEDEVQVEDLAVYSTNTERRGLPQGAEHLLREIVAKELLCRETKYLMFQLEVDEMNPIYCDGRPEKAGLLSSFCTNMALRFVQEFPGICQDRIDIGVVIPRSRPNEKVSVHKGYHVGGPQVARFWGYQKSPVDLPQHWYLLSLVCCMQPPVSLVKTIYKRNTSALTESKTDSIFVGPDLSCWMSYEEKERQADKEMLSNPHPLHLASLFHASLEVVSYLVSLAPADVNMGIAKGHLPIHLALLSRSPACEFLLEKTDPEVIKQSQRTARTTLLHCAAYGGVDLELVRRIYDMNPKSIRTPDWMGRNPIQCALAKPGANAQVVEFLVGLEPRALPHLDVTDESAFSLAAKYQSVEVNKLLLQHARFQDPPVNNTQNTLLHMAVESNTLEVVKFLAAQFPGMLTFQNNEGETPLHLASGALSPHAWKRGCRPEPYSLEMALFLAHQNPSALFVLDHEGQIPLTTTQSMLVKFRGGFRSFTKALNRIQYMLVETERGIGSLLIHVYPPTETTTTEGGEKPTHFKMRQFGTFCRPFERFHETHPGAKYEFWYKGKLLQPHDKPVQLMMESGERIQAKVVKEE